jgi:hypothetical protein
MAVPSSGQLRLRADIALEVDGSATNNNVSLNTLSNSAGFTAPNGMEEFYGYSNAVAPSVQTYSSISVGTSSMTIRGNVSSDGGGAITQRGFYFGTSTNATSNTKYTVSGTTGSFSRSMTGLSAGTTYRVFAFATNSAGTTIGGMVSTGTAQPSTGISISVSHISPAPATGSNSGCQYSTQISGGLYGSYSGSVVTTQQNMYNSHTGNCTSSCSGNTRYPSSGSINQSKQWHASSIAGAGFIIYSVWSASGYSSHSFTHGSYYGPGQNGC